jgi:hypothetical protein
MDRLTQSIISYTYCKPTRTRSPALCRALIRHYWPGCSPSLPLYDFYDFYPCAFLRLRAWHDEAPHVLQAEEEARLAHAYGDEELTVEVRHPSSGRLAVGTIPIDPGFLSETHALRCTHPFPLLLEEWMRCHLVVSIGGRTLWDVDVDFEEVDIEPSQPFFQATPGEERWQGVMYGFGSLRTQPPRLTEADVMLEGGELVVLLTVDCAFPACPHRRTPLCEVEEDELLSTLVPLRTEAVTLEFGFREHSFSFPSRYALLKAIDLSLQAHAWAAAEEEEVLQRLVNRFKGSVLLLEVLDDEGRVMGYHSSEVVVKRGQEEEKAEKKSGGGAAPLMGWERSGEEEEGNEEWEQDWEGQGQQGEGGGEGQEGTNNDDTHATDGPYALPQLFQRRGAPLQWAAGAGPGAARTAEALHDCDFRLLLLDNKEGSITTLSESIGDDVYGRTLAPYARAVWLQPQFCRMPRRVGGGVAVRLALLPTSLQPELQGELEVREAPFASVAAMLRCLEMCLAGLLDDGAEEEEEEEEEGEDGRGEGEAEGEEEGEGDGDGVVDMDMVD